jgi:hypothetical protein
MDYLPKSDAYFTKQKNGKKNTSTFIEDLRRSPPPAPTPGSSAPTPAPDPSIQAVNPYKAPFGLNVKV